MPNGAASDTMFAIECSHLGQMSESTNPASGPDSAQRSPAPQADLLEDGVLTCWAAAPMIPNTLNQAFL